MLPRIAGDIKVFAIFAIVNGRIADCRFSIADWNQPSVRSQPFTAALNSFPVIDDFQSKIENRQSAIRSFDIQRLFAQFFNFRLHLNRLPGNFQSHVRHISGFGKQRIGLAIHLLQQEIQFLPDF